MPRKSEENSKDKSKAKQKDHPQPVLHVGLPETKPASNSDPIATWETLAKDGDQDRQRRPSKTSGASREETSFGPDVLFDQDEATPPPGRRKPTVKSMAHKLAKSVGLRKSKGASNSEDEPQTPLSPPPDSLFPEDASNLGVHSTETVGSGLENIAEHPLSPNRVTTLESYMDLPEVKSGDTASQMSQDSPYTLAHSSLQSINTMQEETVVDDPRTTSALLPKNKPPLVPNRAIRTVMEAFRDSLQESPPTSPLYDGGISSGGSLSDESQDGPYRQLTHPQQVNSMDSSSIPDLIIVGHKSLPIDSLTGRSADSTQVLRLRSQPSNSSEDSDCVVGLEDSFPIHLMTGEQKMSDFILANLRDENDRLRREVEEKDKMIALSSALSEEYVRSGEDTTSGSLPDFPSGPDSHGLGKESKDLFDDAMKAGYVTMNVSNALILGMAGVGKTLIKHILLGLLPPDVRSSTPLADAPIQIHIRDVSGVKVQTGQSGWKPVEGDELQKIVIDTISTIVSNFKDVPESRKRELQEQVASYASGQSISTTSAASTSRNPGQSKQSSSEQGFQGVIANFMGTMVSMVTDKSSEAQVAGRDPREVLGSNWIYFTDSGGQPHFHNLLPHFLQGISAALFVHRLSERLDAHPMVEYYEDGRPISAPHRSPITIEDTIKCLVRSMQTRSVDGEKPNLVFLGTFLDKIQESSESMEEKNEKLLKLLSSEFRNQLVFYNEAENQLIFAVNAKHPGALEEEVARLIREVVEMSPSRKIKVPIVWYVLEIAIDKITHHLGRNVLSKKECLEVAQQLNCHEKALTAALKFFHEQHLFHYFPEVLPEVVFCSPQVLLDKLTELVKDAYLMRESISTPTIPSSHSPTTTVGKRRLVRDKGVVTLEFLEQFPRHYADRLFTPPDLLQIFMRLLILTPFSTTLHGQVDFSSPTTQYYMPSLLDMLPPSDLEKQRVFSAAAAPMLIRFPNGWPRTGVFCCLQVDLIQNRKWELVQKDGKPKLIAQNCVMLSPPKSACVVNLIDSFSYIEVHVKASHSVCHRVCPLIRDDILLAIDASCRALRYASDLPEFAFFCPHDDSPSTVLSSDEPSEASVDSGVSQRHAALLLKEDKSLKCTHDHGIYSELQKNHSIWIPDLPSAEGPAAMSAGFECVYETMLECQDKIIDGLAKEPEDLAIAFHRKGFIAQNIVDRINELPATKRDKARTLNYAILDTVQFYPHRYENFLAVLKRNPRLYGDLLAALERTLHQKRRLRGTSILN